MSNFGSMRNFCMPVLWFDDGTLEFMVLWRDPGQTELQWTQHHGIWWLRAPSKMTRKTTYPEILRFFLSRGKNIDIYVDDEHRGHGGIFPERFLESLSHPCKRVRVLGTCTGHIQPADRPQANKELKRLVRKAIRRFRVRAALRKECKLHKGLTRKAREDISVVLNDVRNEFNSSEDRRNGVKLSLIHI